MGGKYSSIPKSLHFSVSEPRKYEFAATPPASTNLFCPNSTHIHRDEALADWFCREMAPVLEADPKAEVLHNNTDLGVG